MLTQKVLSSLRRSWAVKSGKFSALLDVSILAGHPAFRKKNFSDPLFWDNRPDAQSCFFAKKSQNPNMATLSFRGAGHSEIDLSWINPYSNQSNSISENDYNYILEFLSVKNYFFILLYWKINKWNFFTYSLQCVFIILFEISLSSTLLTLFPPIQSSNLLYIYIQMIGQMIVFILCIYQGG